MNLEFLLPLHWKLEAGETVCRYGFATQISDSELRSDVGVTRMNREEEMRTRCAGRNLVIDADPSNSKVIIKFHLKRFPSASA